jgi:hypothetical protein
MSLGDLVSKLCLTTTPSTQDGRMGFELTTLVVIDTDCIGSSKSNYHAIKTKTVPNISQKICRYVKLLIVN